MGKNSIIPGLHKNHQSYIEPASRAVEPFVEISGPATWEKLEPGREISLRLMDLDQARKLVQYSMVHLTSIIKQL